MMNVEYIRTALTCKGRECNASCPCYNTNLCREICNGCNVYAPEDILDTLDFLGINYEEVEPYED